MPREMKFYSLQRWTPRERLTAQHVNRTTINQEALRQNVAQVSEALDTEFGDREDGAGGGSGGAPPIGDVQWVEVLRQEVNVPRVDSAGNTWSNDIATQILMVGTINGQQVTWQFNYTAPP